MSASIFFIRGCAEAASNCIGVAVSPDDPPSGSATARKIFENKKISFKSLKKTASLQEETLSHSFIDV